MMENLSGLRPLGRAILVLPYEPEKRESVIALPDFVDDRTKMIEQRAVVVATGPAAWRDEPPRARPGDLVMVARHAGVMVKGPADGKIYRAVNDNDIFLGIDEEKRDV